MRDWLRLLAEVVRLMRRVAGRPAAALVAVMVSQAGGIAGLAIGQRLLIDASAGHRGWGVVGAVLLAAAAYAVSEASGRVMGRLSVYVSARTRAAFTEGVQRIVSSIPTVTHLEYAPYIDRWNRIFDSSYAIVAMPWAVLGSFVAMLSLAVTVGLLGSVSPWLCLLAVLGVPLLLATRRADRLHREARDANSEPLRQEKRLHELTVQPAGAKEIIVSGAGPVVDRRAAQLWETAARREAIARLRGAAGQAAAWIVYAAGFAGALVVVATEIRSGRTSLGTAVLVVSLATQLQSQLRSVLDSVALAAQAGQAVSHYWWLRRYAASFPGSGEAPPEALRTGITLEKVGFRYPGAERDALAEVDLHLPAGSTVAIVGANGAGKSTLVKLLTGLHEPTRGRVTVDGVPLSTLDSKRWRARLTGVYQDFAQLRMRLRETVGIGQVRQVRDRPVVLGAVSRAGAPLFEGLETQLGAEFDGLEPSLGQWQRLALARSLMRDRPAESIPAQPGASPLPPLLVVLDEPTAALDPIAEHELFAHVVDEVRRATHRGAVTVLVSHRFTTVRMAGLIVVLDDGRVVERGSHDELMAAGGGYAELYRLQERAYR